MPTKKLLHMHPAALVLVSFLLIITVGAFLLALPVSLRDQPISPVDALFTATSAVCVTGLAVVDTATHFSVAGQIMLLGLIQIGGLGVMTISVFLFQWLGKSISFRQRMAVQEVFAHTPRRDILRLIRSVIGFTLATELMGAVLLTIHWCGSEPLGRSIYLAVFHAVSAFCNAGFALFADSLVRYSDSRLLNLTICALIVLGGIGFPVLYDLYLCLRLRGRRRRLSLQSKTVLITTAILIVAGAILFGLLEWSAIESGQGAAHIILTSLFQSITCRTAGFNTVDIAALREATLVVMIFLMFFGASPGSCGGGVKTTTLALLASFTLSRIRRQRRVNLFKKSIPVETIGRSISLILVSVGIVGGVVFLLLVGDVAIGREISGHHGAMLTYLFETVSAFATVGLSMGVTAQLTDWSKLLLVATMIIGRVGVLTFAYLIVGVGPVRGREYAEENLMIG